MSGKGVTPNTSSFHFKCGIFS